MASVAAGLDWALATQPLQQRKTGLPSSSSLIGAPMPPKKLPAAIAQYFCDSAAVRSSGDSLASSAEAAVSFCALARVALASAFASLTQPLQTDQDRFAFEHQFDRSSHCAEPTVFHHGTETLRRGQFAILGGQFGE